MIPEGTTRKELLIEANRRGLLKGRKKELFDEAVRRGLITDLEEDTRSKSLGLQFLAGILDLPRAFTDKIPFTDRDIPLGDIAEPKTGFQRGARLAGQTALLAAPIGGAASLVPRAAATAPAGLRFVQNLISGIGRTFRAAPAATVATETAIAVPAGITGFAAGEKFPDSKAATFIGDIIGGIGAGLLPSALFKTAKGLTRASVFATDKVLDNLKGIRAIYRPIKAGVRDLSPGAKKVKASERLRELTDPDVKFEDDVLPGLTLAQRSKDKGLLSLEKSIIGRTETTKKEAGQQIAGMVNLINTELTGFAGQPSSPGKTKEILETAQIHLKDLLNTRVRQAALEADNRIRNLAPGSNREMANSQARKAIDSAFNDALKQERDLYSKIPQDSIRPTAHSVKELERIINDSSKAQFKDIPEAALKFLRKNKRPPTEFIQDPKTGGTIISLGEEPAQTSFLGDATSVKELRGLQSDLRRTARNAVKTTNKSQNRNKGRIANRVADAITLDLKDLSLADPTEAGLVETAVAFSKDLNTLFREGALGDILGFVGKTPESLSIEGALTSGGPKGRQAFDDIVRALDTTRQPEFVKSAEDFVLNRFFQDANVIKDGVLNTVPARNFIRKNQELLKRLPDIQNRLTQAIESQDVSLLRQRQKARVDLKKSKATLFIQDDPAAAFEKILKLPNPGREVQKLINRTRRDKTGEATKGLKNSFMEFMTHNASSVDAQGNSSLSGFKFRDLLKERKTNAVVQRLFTPAEKERLNIITNTAVAIEKATAAKELKGGVLDSPVADIIRRTGSILGAVMGRRMGTGTIQVPGIMAKEFNRMAEEGFSIPAETLIIDAMQDEKLFRELLLSQSVNGELSKKARKRFGAWVAASFADLSVDDDDDARASDSSGSITSLSGPLGEFVAPAL